MTTGLWPMLALGIWLASLLLPGLLAATASPALRAIGGFALPLVLIAGSLWGIRLLGGRAADLGWRRPPSIWRSALFGILAGVGAWIVFLGFGALLEFVLPDLDTLAPYREWFEEPALLVSLTVSAVVFAPVAEELYWRGFVLSCLADGADRSVRAGRASPTKSRTLWIPIAVTSVLWAAAHLNPAALAQLVLFGLLLGWLRARDSGSLVMPIAAHATNNALTMIGVLLARSAL